MRELRVLIADDEPLSRNGIRDFFDWSAMGMTVAACVEDGAQALDYLRANPVELVITDIRMPVMDGLELLEHISAENLPTLAVVVSAYNDQEYVMRALRSHVAYDYVLKPLDMESCADTFARAGEYYRTKFRPAGRHSAPEAPAQPRAAAGELLRLVRTLDRDALADAVSALLQPYEHDLGQAAEAAADALARMGFLLDEMGCRRDPSFDYLQILNDIRFVRTLEELKDLCLDYAYRSMGRIQPPPQAQTLSPVVRAAMDLARQRYADSSLSLASLAREVYVTPNYLSSCFRAETGMRFTRWLNDLRMEQAKLLLEDPKYCVYEVSGLVGMDNPKYFAKLFREYTGMKPTEYKHSKGGFA